MGALSQSRPQRAARGLLLDLDDTLYSYPPVELHARGALLEALALALGCAVAEASQRYDAARKAVKARLGERAAAHSRLLYLAELVQAAGRIDLLGQVRGWERLFWERFLDKAELRPGAQQLLESWRARGGKVAIVTDLTLEVQLWKLERFGLLPLIDALAASEEVPLDKPAPELFELAISRLGLSRERCVVVGDSPAKDGLGARRLGMPFHLVDPELGLSPVAAALELG
jgi:HAD superfamily hydrolase (TIGR01549 family)